MTLNLDRWNQEVLDSLKKPQKRSQERIAHLMRLAARGFNRSLQIRLADYDVTFGQWLFLRLLWEEDGLTQRELSERAGLTEPTTHTALHKLESLGYVSRKNLPGNKRKQYAFLTKEGQKLREVLEPLAVDVNKAALEGISAQDVETLRQLLLKVLDNLDADEERSSARGRKVPPTRIPTES